jgi:poly(3-hydroxybutyrate) depolymerase
MFFSRATLLALCVAVAPASAQDLPALQLDQDATTVSGLSSGAFMAVQVHVAFSDAIAGAGVVAGGPYLCAEGSVLRAIGPCMDADGDGPDVAPLLEAARGLAADGLIAPLAGLAGDRVYLFSGTQDATVTAPAVASALRFYRRARVAAADLSHVTDVPAGHAFLAPGGPVDCGVTAPPFISDCGVEQAHDILTWLYGPLEPAVEPVRAHLSSFDQSLFLADPEKQSMDETGYVYVPASCAEGATCRLHAAFHGCQQGAGRIGDTYAWTTGYNGWAEANGIVVLYPQARASITGGNPNGCWDWWGYGGPNYATRQAPQMVAVARMAQALGVRLQEPAPICVVYDEFNAVHFTEERADPCGFSLCAVGSGDPLGPWTGASVLYGTSVGAFTTTGCAQP